MREEPLMPKTLLETAPLGTTGLEITRIVLSAEDVEQIERGGR
jgi:hypothetical protein